MAYVGVVIFKRTKSSKCEYGFDINEDVLVDAKGEKLDCVYDLKYLPHLGCFHLPDECPGAETVPVTELVECDCGNIERAPFYELEEPLICSRCGGTMHPLLATATRENEPKTFSFESAINTASRLTTLYETIANQMNRAEAGLCWHGAFDIVQMIRSRDIGTLQTMLREAQKKCWDKEK